MGAMLRPTSAHAALLALAIVGCSSSSNTGGNSLPPGGMCSPLQGSFRLTFVTRSGNCGDIPEQIVNYDSPTTRDMTAGCEGGATLSSDKCRGDFDYTCPVPDGNFLREEGVVRAAADGQSALATEQITVLDSRRVPICSGTYDVTFKKL